MGTPDESGLTVDERAVFSALGAIRFDAVALAQVLRSRPLTRLEAMGLANLLEGSHPDGLKLQMVGQGKGWMPISEGARKWDQCVAIGTMMESLQAQGLSWEQATIDAAECFGVSESTISRAVRLFRVSQEAESK